MDAHNCFATCEVGRSCRSAMSTEEHEAAEDDMDDGRRQEKILALARCRVDKELQ